MLPPDAQRACATRAAGAQTAVFFCTGDRVLASEASPLVARLQRPDELAAVLKAKFPGSSLQVVLPERYDAAGFACHDAFLPPGPLKQGVPARYDAAGYPAAQELYNMLAGGGEPKAEKLTLVGHSKGAVVLRQVVEELAAWQRAVGMACAACSWDERRRPQQPAGAAAWEEVLAHIHELHWLDAGANTCGAVYPTSPETARLLARRCAAHRLHLYLHGTPRQWHDPQRRWLGREKDAMLAACATAGVPCRARLYSDKEGQPAGTSMDMHFAVIEAFNTI